MKQHYLPAAYLKFFSRDPSKGRKAQIFRYDGKESSIVSVESQCFAKFFYSALKAPLDVEKYFGVFENKYPIIVRKIIDYRSLTDREYYSLILTMFDFHMRNIAYGYRGFSDRFKAYQQMSELFIQHVIAGLFLEFQSNPTGVALTALKKKWKFRSIQAVDDDFFITSDHPSLWFQLGANKPVLVILPITPLIISIAYDISEVEITADIARLHDISVLNGYQCIQSYNAVFSPVELTEAQKKGAQEFFKHRSKRGWIRPGRCSPELFTCPLPNESRRLSFLKFGREIDLIFPRQ